MPRTSTATLAPHGEEPAKPVVRRFRPCGELDGAVDEWLKSGLVAGLPDVDLNRLFAVRPRLFADLEHLVVPTSSAEGAPLAALGSRWVTGTHGTRFLHISVMFVSTALRGGPLFAESWLALLDEVVETGGFPYVSVLKTYNPVAYCAMRAYGLLPGCAMYPAVGAPIGEHDRLATLAEEAAATIAAGYPFDAATGRIAGIGAPRDLYHVRPVCDDGEVNRFFAAHAQPDDRILCLVHVTSPVAATAILEGFRARSRRLGGSPGERAEAEGR